MRAYIIRRLLLILPTMFVISLLLFFPIRFLPGDVIQIMAGEHEWQMGGLGGGEDYAESIRKQLGLDVPVHVQYARWMGMVRNKDGEFAGLLQGNFGKSLWTGRPVLEDILPRIPVSLELNILSLIISMLLGLSIGIYSAIRQDTAGDYLGRSFAIISLATPAFWLGTLLFVFGALWWNWSPPVQYIPFTQDPLRNIGMLLIPAFLTGSAASGGMMRLTRTVMLEVLRQDYIRTAWAKGLKERVVIVRHALRNALIPVVTAAGMRIPFLIGGSVIMETIFALPGMGRLMIFVLNQRDYPVLAGINIIIASFVLIVNLIVDLTYAYLDPRVKYK